MRQSFKGQPRDIITMEEYLKKRQAMRKRRPSEKAGADERAATALKLAEILYV